MKNKLFLFLACCLLCSCYHRTDAPRGSWAKGADISWLSEMEHDSVFHDDCIATMRAMGMNAVRLRVWVNHITDFFADPSHQTIPAAWQKYDYPTMLEAVREHTLDVLYTLKEAGIKPEWVQIGNETPNGMLWPMGKVNKEEGEWEHYAGFTAMGYEAAKEAFPDITVIVHVDNAYEQRDWFWTQMAAHGGKWDMIGLSHYPMMSAWNGGKTWQEMNELAETNIRRLISQWHCPVMIAEIGMFANDTTSATVMADFVQRAQAIDSCAGIFYWEPEVFGGWRPAEYIPLGWGSYDMGAFTPEGQPSEVMKILLESHQ